MKNTVLAYLAQPKFGGWVSFTAHLALSMYKSFPKNYKGLIGTHRLTTAKPKNFGYGLQEMKIHFSSLNKIKERVIITAIDKHFYHCIEHLPLNRTWLVVHDPTELSDEVLYLCRNVEKVITIRPSVKQLLESKHSIKSEFLRHPFFPFPKPEKAPKTRAVSVSRIDFDKHTDLILKANQLLEKPIEIYGAVNRLYSFHKLGELGFEDHYKGEFKKSFKEIGGLLNNSYAMVDMSAIKNDGGGSQYTFLEAMYMDAALILNSKWFEGAKDLLEPGVNCLSASSGEEIKEALSDPSVLEKIASKAVDILQPHLLNLGPLKN